MTKKMGGVFVCLFRKYLERGIHLIFCSTFVTETFLWLLGIQVQFKLIFQNELNTYFHSSEQQPRWVRVD